jgi:glycosyltransferase involved in cell wall biosynthesis
MSGQILGQPMISFIVPAHNEQACLPRTLRAIHESARVVGRPYEIIVVDDASTDATAEIARQNNAGVVSVIHRQIAATRNSGARASIGEQLFFVDADTTINPAAVASALRAMDKGAVGGGAPTWLGKGEVVPLYIWLLGYVSVVGTKLIGFTGGAFMFCTRQAFQATGGFNERMFWGEEGGFAMALKREGRFVVVLNPVLTSGRRFRKTSALQLLAGGVRMVFSPIKMITQRASVEKIWYDSNRADDDKAPDSLAARISNGIAFVLLVVLLTAPLWNFVPMSLTPRSSPHGKVRFMLAMWVCHVCLIFWPIGLVLVWHLFQRKHWLEWMKLAALCAFSVWQAWSGTRCVIRIWTVLGHWLGHFDNG